MSSLLFANANSLACHQVSLFAELLVESVIRYIKEAAVLASFAKFCTEQWSVSRQLFGGNIVVFGASFSQNKAGAKPLQKDRFASCTGHAFGQPPRVLIPMNSGVVHGCCEFLLHHSKKGLRKQTSRGQEKRRDFPTSRNRSFGRR